MEGAFPGWAHRRGACLAPRSAIGRHDRKRASSDDAAYHAGNGQAPADTFAEQGSEGVVRERPGKPPCGEVDFSPGDTRIERRADPSGWGELLFDGAPDCEAGYLAKTWDLFGRVYRESGVIDTLAPAGEGLNGTVLEALKRAGHGDDHASNAWIGRLGP